MGPIILETLFLQAVPKKDAFKCRKWFGQKGLVWTPDDAQKDINTYNYVW